MSTIEEVVNHLNQLNTTHKMYSHKILEISYYIGKYISFAKTLSTDIEFPLGYSQSHARFLCSFYRFVYVYRKFLKCHISLHEFKRDFCKIKLELKTLNINEKNFWKDL